MKKIGPKAFISYSWDSDHHQQWIINLANQMRVNGVDAQTDIFLTQNGTVNLNNMMVLNMKDSDYIIVVLTEDYAKKAENFSGGVGYETTLSLSDIRKTPDKYIFIVRHNGNFDKAIPYHLQGYYVIDFSDDLEFDIKLKELLHRIYRIDQIEVAPLGNQPDLQPSKFINLDENDLIKLRNNFLKKSLKDINSRLVSILEKTVKSHSNFRFETEDFFDNINFKLLINNVKYSISLSGYSGSGDTISIYAYNKKDHSEKSIEVEVSIKQNPNNEFKLMLYKNFSNQWTEVTPEEVAELFWEKWHAANSSVLEPGKNITLNSIIDLTGFYSNDKELKLRILYNFIVSTLESEHSQEMVVSIFDLDKELICLFYSFYKDEIKDFVNEWLDSEEEYIIEINSQENPRRDTFKYVNHAFYSLNQEIYDSIYNSKTYFTPVSKLIDDLVLKHPKLVDEYQLSKQKILKLITTNDVEEIIPIFTCFANDNYYLHESLKVDYQTEEVVEEN